MPAASAGEDEWRYRIFRCELSYVMREFTIPVVIGLAIGFIFGYGVRAIFSHRRHLGSSRIRGSGGCFPSTPATGATSKLRLKSGTLAESEEQQRGSHCLL